MPSVKLSYHTKSTREAMTMSDNIIQLNEDLIKHDLKDLVRSSVEETLNALPDHEADGGSWQTVCRGTEFWV